MLKMGWLFHVHLLILCLMGLTGASQESIELLSLFETSDDVSQASSHTDPPVAVAVSHEDLNGVSSSILLAESWLRSSVLGHYPAARITTIIVNVNFGLCQGGQEQKLRLVLPSLKNVYHSLKRWGLEKEIKVSVAFYLDCLPLNSLSYNSDLKMVKPIIEYLQSVNSTYSLIPQYGFSQFSDESLSLVSSHLESMKNLGFYYLQNVNVLSILPKRQKPITRKLSVVDSSLIGPFPTRPTPLSEIAEPPMYPSVGYPTPANEAGKPLPPQAQLGSPSPMPSTFAPELPPFIVPASSPHHGFTLPPCNPIEHGSPKPQQDLVQKSWCVSRPSVPAVKLQQAIEYACGEGGADCEEITPKGKCYSPDNLVSHASYAFNSYWQKHKRNGGTCNFGGTAMLIDSDPSFLYCRFILS